jgi:peroxiredoxin (alkyl hydroperoxide reductase subunit C)
MEVNTTHGKKTLPDDYKGHWLVLFSHPGDFTPVCTTEFYSFAKKNDEFEKLNTKLIGHSLDQVFSHIKWTEWINEKLGIKVPFPIIADEMGVVAQKLGMIHSSKGTNTVRAVFIVDPNGNLRTMLYYPQELGRNMDEVLRIVKALQVGAENKAAMPANWPNNELIGNKVIIPPAADEKTAEERRKNTKDCYDWWFCYKDMK